MVNVNRAFRRFVFYPERAEFGTWWIVAVHTAPWNGDGFSVNFHLSTCPFGESICGHDGARGVFLAPQPHTLHHERMGFGPVGSGGDVSL